MVRSEIGGTTRGAARSGAQHTMAVNESVLAFALGGSVPGVAGGGRHGAVLVDRGRVPLPGSRRKVRPADVRRGPESGVPVLMVEVARSTLPPGHDRTAGTERHGVPRARGGSSSSDRGWRRSVSQKR